jgi:Ca-activated chloride channel family protein
MTFLNPKYFFLLLLLIPLIIRYIWKQKTMTASLQISSFRGFGAMRKSKIVYFRHLPFVLRMLALATLVVALARPQSFNKLRKSHTEGIDIMIAFDVSTSMLAMDFKPNRVEAAKEIAIEFIKGRPDDKIGLVIFAAESYTQCPLTLDHNVLINLFKDVQLGMLEDGTAIGNGLATAVSRLRNSDAKSKVIILLTDGENNRGEIQPLQAAEIAREFGIRVYCVGVGTIGMAPFPQQTQFGTQIVHHEVRIDEPLMREIAGITGGHYFRATDNDKLAEIYREIDLMEKTKIEVEEFTRTSEEFLPFAILAFLLLLSEIVLRNLILRVLP